LNHPYLFTPLALKWQSARFLARRWNFQGKSLIGYRIRPGIDWLAQGDARNNSDSIAFVEESNWVKQGCGSHFWWLEVEPHQKDPVWSDIM
jgi:hypothetical protein